MSATNPPEIETCRGVAKARGVEAMQDPPAELVKEAKLNEPWHASPYRNEKCSREHALFEKMRNGTTAEGSALSLKMYEEGGVI